jgi:hypothetical protein
MTTEGDYIDSDNIVVDGIDDAVLRRPYQGIFSDWP